MGDAVEYTVIDADGVDRPSARASAASCVDHERQELILFGGVGAHNFLGDLWTLSTFTMQWQSYTPGGAAPSPRSGAVLCLVTLASGERRIVLFGGRSDGGVLGDLYSVDCVVCSSWLRHLPLGDRPTAREDAVAVSGAPDAFGGMSMVLIGGVNARREPLADLWVYNPSAAVWTVPQQCGSAPRDGLAGASAVKVGLDRAVVFGGFTNARFCNTLRILDLRSFLWRELDVRGTVPRPRTHACVATINHVLYMYAGYAGTRALSDMARINLSDIRLPPHPVFFGGGASDAAACGALFVWETVDLPPGFAVPRGAASATAGTTPDGRPAFIIIGGFDGKSVTDTQLVVRLGVPRNSGMLSPPPREHNAGSATDCDRDEAVAVRELDRVVQDLRSAVLMDSHARPRSAARASLTPSGKHVLHHIRRHVKAPEVVGDTVYPSAASSYTDILEALRRENDELRRQLNSTPSPVTDSWTQAGDPLNRSGAGRPFDAAFL